MAQRHRRPRRRSAKPNRNSGSRGSAVSAPTTSFLGHCRDVIVDAAASARSFDRTGGDGLPWTTRPALARDIAAGLCPAFAMR